MAEPVYNRAVARRCSCVITRRGSERKNTVIVTEREESPSRDRVTTSASRRCSGDASGRWRERDGDVITEIEIRELTGRIGGECARDGLS